jgi:hypothetical protein
VDKFRSKHAPNFNPERFFEETKIINGEVEILKEIEGVKDENIWKASQKRTK